MKNLEVEIEKLDHFGRGISKELGKPIFIENALPKELVKIEIIKENKNLMEGKVLEYIRKSDDRVEPICPYYNECGGCNIMHLSYKEQLKYKESKVKEIMKKFTDFDNVNSIIGSSQLHYRNKATFQVSGDLGYYKKKSNDIVKIDECFIVDNRINSIISKLNKLNLSDINQVVIKASTEEIMLVFYSDKEVNINIHDFDVTDIISIVKNKRNILKGKGYIINEINGLKFVISPTSFFQVNNEGMINLYNKVLEYGSFNKEDEVLDLYCGTGTIGIYVSKYCRKVFGVEINEEAIKDAFINKKINSIDNIDFQAGDVGKILKQSKFKPDTIIVDPPRAGLDKLTINKLKELKPKKIIYVSCDPVTLARDLNILKSDFDIVEITPVDMFANTYHVENVCLLTKKVG